MTEHQEINQPARTIPAHDESIAAAMEALYPEQAEPNVFRRRAIGIGLGIAAIAGAGVAYHAGVDVNSINHALDMRFVPSVQAYPKIVDGMVAVNEGLRGAAPVIAAGGLTTYLYQKYKARVDTKEQRLGELARVDYSGIDSANQTNDSGENPTFRDKINRRMRKVFAAGIGVAALTTLLVGGSSGVEHEVSNGPLRPVEHVFDILAPNAITANRQILVQGPNNSFMDDSYLNRARINTFASDAAQKDIQVLPFNKLLTNVDGRSGLAISVPDALFERISGEKIDDSCSTIPVLLDVANTKPVGESVSINGVKAQIERKISGAGQMNRDVVVMADTDMKNCIQDNADAPYFGAVVSGNESAINSLMESHGLKSELSNISQQKFEANNRKFWRANGTPILLQLMAYVGILGAFATGNERRGAMQRNVREIGILNAQGVSLKTITKIESRRALIETNKAALIAAPLMPVMAAVFNMAEVGLKVGVGVRELAVGYAVTLAAKLFGGRRAVKKFGKNLDVAEVVKG